MTKQKEPMIGRTFGRLTVISEAGRSKNGSITYLCSCSCGNQVIVAGTDLRNSRKRSCGCLKKEQEKEFGKLKFLDLTGEVINGIKVIKEAGRDNKNKVKWLCICPECGEEFITLSSSLVNSSVKRCPKCSKRDRSERMREIAINRREKLKENIIGNKYGDLIILEKSTRKNTTGKSLWVCLCTACGHKTELSLSQLKYRKTCGCIKPNTKHGLKNHRLYHIWGGMKARCNNPNSENYKNYGERGISICNEWFSDFKTFYDWAMSHGYEDTLTIERIDVNGNYCPENCTWIPQSEQGNNTRRNVKITYKGETLNKNQLAKKLGIPRYIIEEGLRNNNLEGSLTKKRKKKVLRSELFLFEGKEMLLTEICKATNLPRRIIYNRVYRLKWSLEKALNTPIKTRSKKSN